MKLIMLISAIIGFISGIIIIVLNYDIGDYYKAPNNNINFVIRGVILVVISIIVIFGVAIDNKSKNEEDIKK